MVVVVVVVVVVAVVVVVVVVVLQVVVVVMVVVLLVCSECTTHLTSRSSRDRTAAEWRSTLRWISKAKCGSFASRSFIRSVWGGW